MKRTVALTLLGMGAMVVANNAMAQGHFIAANYLQAPYAQVLWDASTPLTGPVTDTGVTLTAWYSDGFGTTPNIEGPSFTVNPALTYGGGGYYSETIVLPNVGDYTVEIRASGDIGFGPLTGVSSSFNATAASTSLPAVLQGGPGLDVSVIPEPTTFALAGLGAAALLIFRRRD